MQEETSDTGDARDEEAVDREADAAAAEAGAIGGRGGADDVEEAKRPLAESGEGVAEGFEQAEEELVENATHDVGGGDPIRDAGRTETDRDDAVHGEADEVDSSEDDR